MRARAADRAAAASTQTAAQLEALLVEYERASESWDRRLEGTLRELGELERRRRAILAAAVHYATVGDPWGDGADQPPSLRLPDVLMAYERNLVRWALAQTGRNQKAAAALLGIRGTTLHEKLKRLGVLSELRRTQGVAAGEACVDQDSHR
jgi:DNA-binding NtrC family response regulator